MKAQLQSPKQRLEYIFGETAKGNGQPFLDALADDAEWAIIGSTGWSKTYRGKTAILRDLIAPLRRALAPPLKTHALHMIAEGNMVAVQGHGENMTREGRRYENTYCWVFAFRDGRVASITEYADTELIRSVLGDPECKRDPTSRACAFRQCLAGDWVRSSDGTPMGRPNSS